MRYNGQLAKLIKAAVNGSKKTCYRIAKDAGVTQIGLHRFLIGDCDLTLSTAEKLMRSLGGQVLWVHHLALTAEQSPWYTLHCAWIALKSSVAVAVQQVQGQMRWHRMTLADQMSYLVRHTELTNRETDAIRALQLIAVACVKKPEKITERQAIDFVVKAAPLVESLWRIEKKSAAESERPARGVKQLKLPLHGDEPPRKDSRRTGMQKASRGM